MKNNLRKGECCLNCVHRITRNLDTDVFCNLDKTLNINIEADSEESEIWQAEHFVNAGDICDDFQRFHNAQVRL